MCLKNALLDVLFSHFRPHIISILIWSRTCYSRWKEAFFGMGVFTSEDLCDEVEEAIKRIMNHLLQCALLLEELSEGGQYANDATKVFTIFFNQEREKQGKLGTVNRQRGRPIKSKEVT